jgi:K+-transporting ATPase ATPase C chain
MQPPPLSPEEHQMIQELRPALILVLLVTALTGLAYPLSITGIAQLIFPTAANGSLIRKEGQVIGSELIGQRFTRPDYFHPRPSAAGAGYEADKSGASNLSPSSRELVDTISARAAILRADVGERRIPIDMVTASGSGLDPHITPQSAFAQAGRVARARNLPETDVYALIRSHTEEPTFTILGERRVNVLNLNLALDSLATESPPALSRDGTNR